MLFNKNYIVYYNVYHDCCGAFIEKVYTMVCLNVSELYGHLCPYIVMYGLRLFIVVLQELHCLPNCLHICMIRVRGCYHFTNALLLVSEIAKCIA